MVYMNLRKQTGFTLMTVWNIGLTQQTLVFSITRVLRI